MSNTLTHKIFVFPSARWIGLVNFVLVALLCWQLAHWTWVFLAPAQTRPTASQPIADVGHASETVRSAHLFGLTREAHNTEARAATALNLKLNGVFAATGKMPAVAIIKVENRADLPFMVGDTVLPGVTLQQVRPDHVVLRRSGVTERLDLEQKAPRLGAQVGTVQLNISSDGAGKYSLAKNELSKLLSDPRQLANTGKVRAVPGQGVTVEETGAGSLIDKLGLQKGDVIRSVNNRPVEQAADLLQGYREQLNQGGVIKVQGTRSGQSFEYNYTLR